jgi:hypothetical protein
MRRTGALIAIGLMCSALAAQDHEKPVIKGGIEGKIKKVDTESKTLTIVSGGKERTFSITDDTELVGPRGGKVHRHLKDPRFREGFPVTVVADGKEASEVHLGFAHDADDEKTASTKTDTAKSEKTQTKVVAKPSKPAQTPADDEPAAPSTTKKTSPSSTQTKAANAGSTTQARTANYANADDESNEFPGKIKSFNKRVLVVTLLNGKDRPFFLSNDVPIMISGKASKEGLADPALKTGAKITVVTEEGGRKVKEVKITPAKTKKAA